MESLNVLDDRCMLYCARILIFSIKQTDKIVHRLYISAHCQSMEVEKITLHIHNFLQNKSSLQWIQVGGGFMETISILFE